MLSTVLRRGYAQPVGHSVLSQQQLSHLAQSDKRTKAKTAVSSPTITRTTAPETPVSSPINMAARSLASEAPNMPSSHQSGLESGRVTGRPASPPPLTPESLLAAMPIGDLLRNLVATQPVRQKQSWTARPVSAGAAVETGRFRQRPRHP